MLRRTFIAITGILVSTAVAMTSAFGQDQSESVDLSTAVPDFIVLGNPNGDVEIHEFSDYFCPACQSMTPQMAEFIEDDGNVRFILHYYPNHGQRSLDFSNIGIAAYNEDPTKFYALHRWMMGQRGRLSKDLVYEHAASLGYDRTTLELGALSADNMQQFRVNISVANQLGLRGTPSFIIEDATVTGFPGQDVIARYIAQVRER